MTDKSQKVTGACLCGAVSYEATLSSGIGACHCGMCRKWSGGPLMSANVSGVVKFTGEENVSRYRSSDWAERGFCNRCGSSLFYYLLPRDQVPDGEYVFTAGSMEDQSVLVFDHEVYVDHAPGWYSFEHADKRNRMTERDVLAFYGVEI